MRTKLNKTETEDLIYLMDKVINNSPMYALEISKAKYLMGRIKEISQNSQNKQGCGKQVRNTSWLCGDIVNNMNDKIYCSDCSQITNHIEEGCSANPSTQGKAVTDIGSNSPPSSNSQQEVKESSRVEKSIVSTPSSVGKEMVDSSAIEDNTNLHNATHYPADTSYNTKFKKDDYVIVGGWLGKVIIQGKENTVKLNKLKLGKWREETWDVDCVRLAEESEISELLEDSDNTKKVNEVKE